MYLNKHRVYKPNIINKLNAFQIVYHVLLLFNVYGLTQHERKNIALSMTLYI